MLPAVETKSMNLEQVKQALASYTLASKEITNSYEAFAKIEEPIIELIGTWKEREEDWLNRQSSAELNKNADLAKEANKRVRAATDTISQLKKSLEAIPSIKEPFPAVCGSVSPQNGSPVFSNFRSAVLTVPPTSKTLPLLLR